LKVNRFGPMFAAKIRKRRARWHAPAHSVALAFGRGVRPRSRRDAFPLRAVDHEGEVLESFITKTRGKAAALKFMKKLMKRHGCAKTITTDGLRSYRAAMSELGIEDRQEVSRWATTGSRTPTSRSDDESGRCRASGA